VGISTFLGIPFYSPFFFAPSFLPDLFILANKPLQCGQFSLCSSTPPNFKCFGIYHSPLPVFPPLCSSVPFLRMKWGPVDFNSRRVISFFFFFWLTMRASRTLSPCNEDSYVSSCWIDGTFFFGSVFLIPPYLSLHSRNVLPCLDGPELILLPRLWFFETPSKPHFICIFKVPVTRCDLQAKFFECSISKIWYRPVSPP